LLIDNLGGKDAPRVDEREITLLQETMITKRNRGFLTRKLGKGSLAKIPRNVNRKCSTGAERFERSSKM